MSARQDRGFVRAFRGVYGDSPAALYARFKVEVGRAALEVEEQRPVDDSLWLALKESTGQPHVSPDGTMVVVPRRTPPASPPSSCGRRRTIPRPRPRGSSPTKPPWSAIPRTCCPCRRRPSPARPCTPATTPGAAPPNPGGCRTAASSSPPGSPTPAAPCGPISSSGTSTAATPASPAAPSSAIPTPTPTAPGRSPIASTGEIHSFVRVDLATGEVSPLLEVPVPEVLASPRISPDGTRLAYMRNDGTWQPRRAHPGHRVRRPWCRPPRARSIADPEWLDADTVLVSLGGGGFIEVAALELDGDFRVLTQSRGAGWGAAPMPDGSAIFHLGLDSDGIDLHHLAVPRGHRRAAARWRCTGRAAGARRPARAPRRRRDRGAPGLRPRAGRSGTP